MTAADAKPLDLSWDEVGPKPRPEPALDSSPWDELDRRVRASISEVLNRAEHHFSSTPLGRLDAVAAIPAFTRTAMALATEPNLALQVGARYATGILRAWATAGARAVGAKVDGPIEEKRDKRFADPAWKDNAAFWLLRQEFELWEQALEDLVEGAPIEDALRVKVAFLTQAMVDAASPTNSFATNPDAMRRAIETGGLSVMKGAQNFLQDLAENNGMPSQYRKGVYEVGKNLAVTPGKVVFRNDLM